MLTPQEVHDKTFPRASFGNAGYNMASVEDFLDVLTQDYSTLYKESAALKAKLKVLAEKVEEYRATEDAMRSMLLDAQRRADQMVQSAKDQGEAMLTAARNEAATEKARLDRQMQDARLRLERARQLTENYVNEAQKLCSRQMDQLMSIPESLSAMEDPSVFEAPVQEEAVPVQEAPVQEEAAAAQEAEADTPELEEETVLPKEEGPAQKAPDDFSEDFRRNLNNLKFGRNYNGEE